MPDEEMKEEVRRKLNINARQSVYRKMKKNPKYLKAGLAFIWFEGDHKDDEGELNMKRVRHRIVFAEEGLVQDSWLMYDPEAKVEIVNGPEEYRLVKCSDKGEVKFTTKPPKEEKKGKSNTPA